MICRGCNLGWPLITQAEAALAEKRNVVRLLCEHGKGTHIPIPRVLNAQDLEVLNVLADIGTLDQESTAALDFLESRKKV